MSNSKLLAPLLGSLSSRQKEVIAGRFGLDKSAEAQTLAAIGERLNVTRERVRQIENSALVILNKEVKKSAACLQVLNNCKKLLKASGGVMKKEFLLEELAKLEDGMNENQLALLIEASGEFYFYSEDEEYWSFYYLSKNDLRAATGFIEGWSAFLKEHKSNILDGQYKAHLKEYSKKKHLEQNKADHFLAISKKIHVNPYGDIGLHAWPEIRPMTTRDRAYLVLKKGGEPLHFVAIADAINQAKLSNQEALAPTVHNELIKDERFVLVGRGIYALKESGYEPGIAREVIQKILKSSGPLKVPEVVSAVQKQRLFKENTIVINLQNKNHFERLPDGRYRVRES